MKKKWIANDIPRVLVGGSLQIILIVISLVLIFSYASAENFKNSTADELKAMMDKKTKLFLVDARPQQEFSQGHIPLSVNIAPDKVGNISALLPKNKKTLIVFYCRGVG